MTYVYLICFLLSVIAVICLLGLTPEGITTDLMKFVSPSRRSATRCWRRKEERNPEN